MIITLCVAISLLTGVLGYCKGFHDCAILHDEAQEKSHRRLTNNPADKIRVPQSRSTDIVPEKLS